MQASSCTLKLSVPPDRDYTLILLQTQTVYDQLLLDKQAKLTSRVLLKKGEYDDKCNALAKTSRDRAMEFGVRSQEELRKLQIQCAAELRALQKDYQNKLNNMHRQLELKWREEMESKGGVECKIYPHK